MYTLQFTKSGQTGTFLPDAGYKWTDRLNMVNEANFIFSSSSAFRRSQVDIGTTILITEGANIEFFGYVDDIQTVDGGGMNVHANGYEGWLGKETGAYASSPWTATNNVTIFNAIVAESTHLTAGSSDSFGNLDFRETTSDSLWNAVKNLADKTGQDLDVTYGTSSATISLKNQRGLGSVSMDILNSGKEIGDISVGRSMPIGNKIIVYGKGEGTTRITNQSTHGQDLASQATWGIITKIVEDYSISTVAEANLLADAEVARYANQVKSYEFSMRVKRFKNNFIAGDLITLNAAEQGLANEEVRIVEIEKGVQNGAEFMNLTVTNSEYARLTKSRDRVIATIAKTAQSSSTYDQYQTEYSNQNVDTCVGAIAHVAYLGGLPYLYMNSGATINTTFLDARVITVSGSGFPQIYMFGNRICALPIPIDDYEAANKLYVDSVAGGGGCWGAGPAGYITPTNSCGLWMCNNIADATSTHCLGTPSSPGAFKEVNAACGVFTNRIDASTICSGGNLEIYNAGNHTASFGSSCTCLNPIRVNGNIKPNTDGSFCVGISGCEWIRVYSQELCSASKICVTGPNVLIQSNNSSGDLCLRTCSGQAAIFYCATPRPSASSVLNLGTSGNRWATAYVVSVNCSSDRNLKTNFQDIDYSDILDKYRCIPLQSWEWKKKDTSGEEIKILEEGEGKRNIGVTAQDFNGAFKDMVGYESEDSINGSDHVGIQDAAIKGMITCIDCLSKDITELKKKTFKKK